MNRDAATAAAVLDLRVLRLNPADPERDLRDASRLITALTSLNKLRDTVTVGWANRAAREALNFVWEQPRGRADREALPWSKDAAEAKLSGTSRPGELVLEHVVPASVVVDLVLNAVYENKTESEQASGVVAVLHRCSILAILHRREKLSRLVDLHFRRKMPHGETGVSVNPWGRYSGADPEFSLDQLKTLAEWRALGVGTR